MGVKMPTVVRWILMIGNIIHLGQLKGEGGQNQYIRITPVYLYGNPYNGIIWL